MNAAPRYDLDTAPSPVPAPAAEAIPGRAAGPRTRVGDLARALEGERRLLRTLEGVLRAQRDGVAALDRTRVEGSVLDAQRVLVTLGEARRHRQALMEVVTGSPETSVRELEDVLGPRMTPELVAARDALLHQARTLAGNVAVNRGVLDSALRTGDTLLRAFARPAPSAGLYGPGTPPPADSGGGGLLDRHV